MRWSDGRLARPVVRRPGGDARRSTYITGRALMANGIIDVPSRYSVPETLARLEWILKEKGLTVFALIDHSGEAEKAGLAMRPTQLLIFGSPKGGTPLMVAAPTPAIDRPLKALAWQDDEGKVWLAYNSPSHMQH